MENYTEQDLKLALEYGYAQAKIEALEAIGAQMPKCPPNQPLCFEQKRSLESVIQSYKKEMESKCPPNQPLCILLSNLSKELK